MSHNKLFNQSNSDKPLVSVCCATYNHESYISESINGILSQETDFPFEIIIRDDASTDATAQIVRSYAAKYPNLVRTVLYSENQFALGKKPSQDWPNFARGSYIAYCEGDDYWTDPHKLQKQLDYLRNHPMCVAVTTYTQVLDESGRLHSDPIPKTHRVQYSDILLGRKHQTRTATLVYKRSEVDMDKLNLMGTFHAGDRKLKLALTMNGGYIQVLPFKSAVYRHHSGGMWSLIDRNKKRAAIQNDYLETHRHFPMSLGLKVRYVWHHFLLTLPGDLRYGRFRMIFETLSALRIKPA